jgi:hypothetical protein
VCLFWIRGTLYVLVDPTVQGPRRVIQRRKFETGKLVTRRASWVCYIGQRIELCCIVELIIHFPLTGQGILVYLIDNFMSAVASHWHRGNLQLIVANLGSSGIQLFPYGLMVNASYHQLLLYTYSMRIEL